MGQELERYRELAQDWMRALEATRLPAIPRIVGCGALCLLLCLGHPRLASAQSESGLFVGGGVGFGSGQMSVGSDSDSQAGLILLAQFGSSRSGYRRLMFEISAQLFDVPNPRLDEEYRSVTGLVRWSFGSRLSVAPGVGLEHRSWTGTQRVTESDTGLAAGISFGGSLRVSDAFVLIPEVTARVSSIELEGSVGGRLLAVQVSLVRLRP